MPIPLLHFCLLGKIVHKGNFEKLDCVYTFLYTLTTLFTKSVIHSGLIKKTFLGYCWGNPWAGWYPIFCKKNFQLKILKKVLLEPTPSSLFVLIRGIPFISDLSCFLALLGFSGSTNLSVGVVSLLLAVDIKSSSRGVK